jgi:hypothetical protein
MKNANTDARGLRLALTLLLVVAGARELHASSATITLSVLNPPNGFGEVIILQGDVVEVAFVVEDPLGETRRQDRIELVRADDGMVVKRRKRGPALSGWVSLPTSKQAALGALRVRYRSVTTGEEWGEAESGVFVVADPAMLALIDRVGALEASAPVPGPMGPAGPAGPSGQDGESVVSIGLPVGDPDCPHGGSLFFVSDTVTYACHGDPGADGAHGEPGPQGPAGADGVDGVDGVNGATGLQGPQGPPGVDGGDGAPGLQGPPGECSCAGGAPPTITHDAPAEINDCEPPHAASFSVQFSDQSELLYYLIQDPANPDNSTAPDHFAPGTSSATRTVQANLEAGHNELTVTAVNLAGRGARATVGVDVVCCLEVEDCFNGIDDDCDGRADCDDPSCQVAEPWICCQSDTDCDDGRMCTGHELCGVAGCEYGEPDASCLSADRFTVRVLGLYEVVPGVVRLGGGDVTVLLQDNAQGPTQSSWTYLDHQHDDLLLELVPSADNFNITKWVNDATQQGGPSGALHRDIALTLLDAAQNVERTITYTGCLPTGQQFNPSGGTVLYTLDVTSVEESVSPLPPFTPDGSRWVFVDEVFVPVLSTSGGDWVKPGSGLGVTELALLTPLAGNTLADLMHQVANQGLNERFDVRVEERDSHGALIQTRFYDQSLLTFVGMPTVDASDHSSLTREIRFQPTDMLVE